MKYFFSFFVSVIDALYSLNVRALGCDVRLPLNKDEGGAKAPLFSILEEYVNFETSKFSNFGILKSVKVAVFQIPTFSYSKFPNC